jgi:hypothetical protein
MISEKACHFAAVHESDCDVVDGARSRHPGTYATITVTFPACDSQTDLDRLLEFAKAKDQLGLSSFVAQRMATKECVLLLLGDKVRIDATTSDLPQRICVRPAGQVTCFWALRGVIDQKP